MHTMLNKILLWKKFAILGVFGFVLAIVPTSLFLLEADKSIDITLQELAGIAPERVLLKAVQQSQQHRALSALVLGGNAGMQAQRQAKAEEANATFKAMETLLRADPGLAAFVQDWQQASAAWKALSDKLAQGALSGPQSFAEHSALLKHLFSFNDKLLDHFGMRQDPKKASFYLIDAATMQAPALSEAMGRTRAKGAAFLSKGSAAPEERATIAAMIDKASEHLDALQLSIGKASGADAGLARALNATAQASIGAGRGALASAQQQIVGAEQLTMPAADFVKQYTIAIDQQFQFSNAAVDQLDGLLAARLSALRTTKLSLTGAILIMFALIGLVAYKIVRSITMPLHQALDVARRVADGDLGSTIEVDGNDETSQLLLALRDMNGSLAAIVGQVRAGTDTIATASAQIASGNLDLSNRTEQQASSLEETSSSMEQQTASVKQNADNARQANALALSASTLALKGGAVVSEVVDTMASIEASSRKIVDIISVIDGIAFQTNILALNAAVEAARAGEQGRGFAVVATEVRSLAQRSAGAAREIKTLIDDSVDKVNAGSRLVSQAGSTMDDIVGSIRRVTDIMSEIATASQEQEAGISQINQAIVEMDAATQQNAALVEQAAAASQAMQEQAGQLSAAVSVFKLGRGAPARPVRALAVRQE